MFGIDFSEILVIFVIALVVLGPERLPKLAATIGRWLGRARSMARQFREQLEHEANRLQHETKTVHDSLDLKAAQPVSDVGSAAGSAPGTAAASPSSTAPTYPAPPGTESSGQAAATAHPGAASEFGLHNAGLPESPATQPHSSGAAASAREPAVAVDGHER
jgi:Tat protein translocase TatB subunit